MKILYKRKQQIALLFLLLGLMACKKFVQIDTPSTLLVGSAVFNDNTTATSAETDIYSQMNFGESSFNMSKYSGLLSDELISYSPSGTDSRRYYANAMTASLQQGFGPWLSAYNYIYQANAILEGMQSSRGVSSAVKKQLSGESKFVRAFWHFYLTNCYGDVPLVTTTNYAVNAKLARSPQSVVYEQIIADLKDAQGLLNSHYVDFTDTVITTERVRPTLWAADALLARVYLYTKKYDLAAAAATEVIDHSGLYQLEPDLKKVFLANSQEAIWQLQTLTINGEGGSTSDGNGFILRAEPNGSGFSISKQLLNSFETHDNRRSNWVRDTTFSGRPYSSPYKYKNYERVQHGTEYVMVLRLAEQFLIRAEARAWLNNTDGAIADLNMIRHRAGLGDYTGQTDQSSLINAILHERQVELFTEWGHRWFDLIRLGKIGAVMNVVTPLKVTGATWNPDNHQALYPIPQSDLAKDNNLTQNKGY